MTLLGMVTAGGLIHYGHYGGEMGYVGGRRVARRRFYRYLRLFW